MAVPPYENKIQAEIPLRYRLYLNNQLENKIILTLKMIGYEQKNIELNLLKSEIDLSKINPPKIFKWIKKRLG